MDLPPKGALSARPRLSRDQQLHQLRSNRKPAPLRPLAPPCGRALRARRPDRLAALGQRAGRSGFGRVEEPEGDHTEEEQGQQGR